MKNLSAVETLREMVDYCKDHEINDCSGVRNACETLFFLSGEMPFSEDDVMIKLNIGE